MPLRLRKRHVHLPEVRPLPPGAAEPAREPGDPLVERLAGLGWPRPGPDARARCLAGVESRMGTDSVEASPRDAE